MNTNMMNSILIQLFTLYATVLTVDTAACSTLSKLPMDIRSQKGVWIDKIPGSRVEYNPFPAQFHIAPGQNIKLEFLTEDPNGLIFVLGNFDVGDIVAAMLNEGYLTFLRRCDSGFIFERYTQTLSGKLNDNQWHKLEYIHNQRGGEMEIDGVNPFRDYQIGPCSDFSSILFGGLAPGMELESWQGMDSYHRFRGCIREMRIDGRIPMIHPSYVAVSACKK